MKAEPLVEAAGLVADGLVPDWESTSSLLSSDEEREIADELALLARIADEHRRLHQLLPASTGSTVAQNRSSWGQLELLDVVGRGSYGTVYRAWDGRLDRQVALKLFHNPRDPESVMREGRALARIRHPSVVSVHGADVVDGVAGIWTEFIRGRSLDQIVKEQGPLSAQEATVVGLEMARALAAVHQARLLHCDVKAQNVVRESGGRLVLMDLGAARAVTEADDETLRKQLTGTPRYMAPELFKHKAATPQSDLYSLGVLLFYLVTGSFPIDGKTLSEIKAAHVERRRRHLRDLRPELPAGYLREVEKALDPDPANRHRSAGELEAALLALAPAPSSSVEQGAAVGAPSMWTMARRLMAAAAVVVLLAAAGMATWKWTAQRGGSRVTAPRSIAVLPIRNLTGDPSKDYLADALTEVLISNLARVRAFQIPSFAAVSQYRGGTPSAAAASQLLGVELLLAGSIVESGSRVRMTVQLYDRGDRVVWADEIALSPSEVLAAQARVARSIASHLAVPLSQNEQRGLVLARLDPRAQEAYLRGLVVVQEAVDLAAMKAAADRFRDAVTIEPTFAEAWAQLSIIELRLMERIVGIDRRAQAALARDLATRAIGLDPALSTGYLALGRVQFYHDWDFVAAEHSLRTAIDVAPSRSDARELLAMLLAAVNRLDEAILLAEEGRALEPRLAVRTSQLAILFYYARDFGRAEAEMKRALTINPGHAPAHFGLGRIYSAMGRHNEAIQSFQRAIAQSPLPSFLVELARAQTAAGDVREAEALLDQLEQRRLQGEGFSLDNHAYIAAAAGNLDEAFKILDLAVADRLSNILWVAVDPRTDPLRNDPRFDKLLAKIGLRP